MAESFYSNKIWKDSTYYNPPASSWLKDGATLARRIIDNLCKTKTSEKPTRAILILPELEDGKRLSPAEYARSKKLLEIIRFPKGTFRGSLYLPLPLNWSDFELALNNWANSVKDCRSMDRHDDLERMKRKSTSCISWTAIILTRTTKADR